MKITAIDKTGPKDSIILIGKSTSGIKPWLKSDHEKDYLKFCLDNKKKQFVFNQYPRWILVHLIDDQKKPNLALEETRKAAKMFADLVNDRKLSSVSIVGLVKKTDHLLAFAEGLALSSYQFNKYLNNRAEKDCEIFLTKPLGIGILATAQKRKLIEKGHIDVGDNLEEWVTPFTPEIIVETFKKLLNQWKTGISILEKTLKNNKGNDRLQKELDLAEHIFLSVKSTIDIIMFYKMLRKFKKNKIFKKLNKTLITLFKDAIEIAKQDKKIIKRNKSFGFHPEAHTYFVTQKDLDYKISLLKSEINRLKNLTKVV